jgi:rhamnogalacturonyl hydrolase YesR
LQQAAQTLLRVRSPTGLWYQVLDCEKGGRAYALMKGQRLGVLPASAGEQGLSEPNVATIPRA